MLVSSCPIHRHEIPKMKDFINTQNLRSLRRFILVHAFSEILTIYSSQLQTFETVSPKCLCEGVSSIITPSIEIGGWKTEFLLQEINIDNVLLGLKVTSQLLAHIEMVLKSLF